MSSTPVDLPVPATTPVSAITGAATHARSRLQSIDMVRGLVMVLMTLDHVRDYFTNAHFRPLDPALTNAPLYVTRWITHLCAPTFVLLAGVSAYLMSQRLSRSELSRFLLTRGLWLVFAEVTIVNFAWTFNVTYNNGVFLQVIWAIGISMIALAALIRLPLGAILFVALALIAGHNLLDGIAPERFGSWAVLWRLLHVQGPTSFGFVAYPVLPWIGVMALGYCAGTLFQAEASVRRKTLVGVGCAAVAAFFVLRLINGYGDLAPWQLQPTIPQTLFAFFDVAKYPPSLLYLLATLGIASLLLVAAERFEATHADSGLSRVLVTFGRVPFFFYVLHLVLAHLAAGLIGLLSGYHTDRLVIRSLAHPPADWGFSLPVVYLAWLGVLLAAWPLCRWYAALKRRRTDWWLSYV